MNNILTKLFMVIMLMMFSMGVSAKVDVELNKEYKGGKVQVKSQEDQADGSTLVTITVAPDNGYTITNNDKNKGVIVVAILPTSGQSGTRAPQIAGDLKVTGPTETFSYPSSVDYQFTVPAGLNAWVQEINFQINSRKWDTTTHPYAGIWYVTNSTNNMTGFVVPAANPEVTIEGHVNEDAYFSNDYTTKDGDPEMPFLTTYPTGGDLNSIWVFVPVDGENNYYYIVHAKTGKYLKFQTYYSDARRKYVHLETIATPGNTEKFLIEANGDGVKIKPKNHSYYFNVAGTNQKRYNGKDSKGTAGYYSGMIGGYASLDDGSLFNLVDASSATYLTPVISEVDGSTNTFTITSPTSAFSSIRYTTDGSTTPDASTGNIVDSGSPVVAKETWNVQAVGVFENFVTPVAGPKELSPVAPPPTITYDYTTAQATITSATALKIYYNTGDGTQATPTPSSSDEFGEPISVTTPTMVKAVAVYVGDVVSEVATLNITQVATPAIQNNGSNAISITSATEGATIYYTTDGSTPDTSSTEYTGPLTENVSNVTVKAIAVKENMITSAVGSGTVKLKCATPVVTRTGLSFTLSCSMPTDANLFYTLNDGSETEYDGTAVSISLEQLPMTITAVARHNDYTDSETATIELKSGTGMPDDPYLIYSDEDFDEFAKNVNAGNTSSACYKLEIDVSGSGVDAITTAFTGTFDGSLHTISNLSHALFNTINGGIVKNVILDNVGISNGTNVGAIVNEAEGSTRIYNCGILSGSVGGSKKVGGLVGLLDGEARVINCFSYADITSGEDKGGIVGYNNVASTQSSLTTMVMNCMFYGDISAGGTISPIYGGVEINNDDGGMNNYNYYRYRSRYSVEKEIDKYNRALAMEEKFINRFERYRLLLNSNRKLAAIYATGSAANADQMAKWILETADRQIANPMPYPVLRKREYNKKYPSIINYDAEHAPDNASVGRNHGGKLGKTLSVTIATSKSDGGQTWPEGASISKTSLTLQRTDKDFDRFNFNYDKVQLPYYNDVGNGNYTGNRVVTGWKIVSIDGGTPGTFKEADEWGGYNFADRNCTNKDKYSVSKRVFSQGAYWDVPKGVTAITIEPYWAIANYVSDATYDVVYDKDYDKKTFTTSEPFGKQYENNKNIDIYGDGNNNQKVYTSISNALAGFDNNSKTVYDQAVVLVGNVHQYDNPTNADIPYTVMSIDMNHDNEPDYSYIFTHDNRRPVSPIRYDFINIMGMAEAQIPNGATLLRNVSIFNLKGWFEITNTCVVNFSQFEYDNNKDSKNGVTKSSAPLILLGGTFEQIVSTQKSECGKTKYIHIGSNAWFAKFGTGTHSDGSKFTPHIPISVTGGDYDEFYLSGTYQPNITNMESDNAECYISGGRFGEVAGASLEAIQGDVRWDINWADITNFYGGGVNAVNPITGDIRVDMTNSHVHLYCGGPKFGDMTEEKKVTTNATDCHFDTYFGAGFGGNAYNRVKYKDASDTEPASHQGEYASECGKYYNGTSSSTSYGKKGKGVATDFDSEFFIWSTGQTGSRFYVQFVTFSLATTHGVTSNLTKCKVTGNVYGGGSLGKVDGDVSTTLNSCEIIGNVFGAGYSATLPTIDVRKTPAFIEGKEPKKNMNIGMFEPGEINTTVKYEWKQVTSMPNNGESGMITEDGKNYVYTDTDLSALGTVTGDVHLTLNNTTVGESVYGGGEQSDVKGNTNVMMEGGYVFNGIFGGGLAGSVGTFTRSTAAADVTVYGHTAHEGCIGKPVSCAANTGKCTVKVTGGQIGPIEVATKGMTRPASEGGPVPEGWVWGGGCGIIEDPETHPDTHFKTYVGSTDVTIGGTAFILESIIGGGEFGRVLGDTHVTIEGNCQIGVGAGQVDGDNPRRYADEKFIDPTTTPITNDNALAECSHYDYGSDVDGDGKPEYLTFDPYYDKYYDATSGSHKDNIPDGLKLGSTSHACDGKTWIGCVFGGGSGYFPYEKDDGTGYGWVRSAGWVEGNTLVEIKGGHILTNVYGANEYTDVKGRSKVIMSGGTIGVPRTLEQIKANPLNGNLFGAGKGDPRTYFNEITTVGSTEVEVTGGIIYGNVYGGGEDGHVTGNAVTTIGKETTTNEVTTKTGPVIGCVDTSDSNGNVFGGGMGSVSTLTAGVVGGNATLGILGGRVLGSVYGGGQIASVGTYLANVGHANYGKMQEGSDHGCLTVNLTGGTIDQNVYGGCMGANADASRGVNEELAVKFGISKTVIVNLNGTAENNVIADNAQGCAVKGSIFGCNNVNSSPEGTVTVHVYGTQHAGKSQIANTNGDSSVTDAKTKGSYDVHAVYGGGNMAAYIPKDLTTGTTNVIIDGCGRTSIQQVYGGGNAASTPATNVTVNGTFEIEEVFGGGNGKDAIGKDAQGHDIPNPGANVGFYAYEDAATDAQTPEDRALNYGYGTGKASVNIFGGTIHRVFGGSNTKGNVRQTAVTMLEEVGGCDFCVDEAYGGGKSAPMDAEAKLLMACIPGLSAAYGGAEAADIQGNVTLTITNGRFERVFGGNNLSGTIRGAITVNVEEVGCKPIIIGELYGGGNQAGYSVYGYKEVTEGTNKVWKPRLPEDGLESGLSSVFNAPVVNVKSFTSIGAVYGGGYGETAVMVGDPTVNISVVEGAWKDYVGESSRYSETGYEYNATGYKGETLPISDGTTTHDVELPSHDKGKIGAIGKVFGGGNAASVKGNTNVNIGTLAKVSVKGYDEKSVSVGASVEGLYTRSGEGTAARPYRYIAATGTAVAGTTYYEEKNIEKDVIGVDIRGNVYGGGNEAEVTGNTNVIIGKEATITTTTP